LFGCKSGNEQLQHFNAELKNLEKTEKYKVVKKLANDTLQKWINSDITSTGIPPLRTFIKWKLDDAIFFNEDKNRCIILILERDTTPYAKLDAVKLLLADYNLNHWNFYFQSLPALFYQRNESKANGYNFDELSALVRKDILKEYYKRNSCKIDSDFFDYDINILKSMQKGFLSEKN
jgi:hypothetical protein